MKEFTTFIFLILGNCLFGQVYTIENTLTSGKVEMDVQNKYFGHLVFIKQTDKSTAQQFLIKRKENGHYTIQSKWNPHLFLQLDLTKSNYHLVFKEKQAGYEPEWKINCTGRIGEYFIETKSGLSLAVNIAIAHRDIPVGLSKPDANHKQSWKLTAITKNNP